MSEGQESGISITGCLSEIRDRLTDAAAVAKAGDLRRERLRASGSQDRARGRGDAARGEHAPERGHAPHRIAADERREPEPETG